MQALAVEQYVGASDEDDINLGNSCLGHHSSCCNLHNPSGSNLHGLVAQAEEQTFSVSEKASKDTCETGGGGDVLRLTETPARVSKYGKYLPIPI